MKKHHAVLLILIANLIMFLTFSIAKFVFGMYIGNQAHYITLGFSYFMPIFLMSSFVLRMKRLSSGQKGKWMLYLLLASFVGSLHFYTKYRSEINKTALETENKMKQGPKSLREFNSRSN